MNEKEAIIKNISESAHITEQMKKNRRAADKQRILGIEIFS